MYILIPPEFTGRMPEPGAGKGLESSYPTIDRYFLSVAAKYEI